MQTLEVSTVVYVPPEAAYEFLLDFPGYADYSEHLRAVERVDTAGLDTEGRYGDGTENGDGDGTEDGGRNGNGNGDGNGDGPGAEYALRFQWWKLGYAARSRVTGVDPPNRIGWEVRRDLDAEGEWRIEAVPEAAPPGRETASRVTLVVRYDPDSADASLVDLPALVSMGWVVRRVQGLVEREGRRVVERVVADLEGERRPVDLDVRSYSSV